MKSRKVLQLISYGNISHFEYGEDYFNAVKADILVHLDTLNTKFSTDEVDRRLDIPSLKSGNAPAPWFGLLNIWEDYPWLKETLPLVDSFGQKEFRYFPSGMSSYNLAMAQLGILLPNTKNVHAALPALITAYVVKYRADMDQSTQLLIYQLLDSRDRKGIESLISRLTMEPWYQKNSNPTYKAISPRSETLLRTYSICLLFSALLLKLPQDSEPYLAVRLFSGLGKYARLFLTLDEFEALKLYQKEIRSTPYLNKLSISVFKKHLMDAVETHTLPDGAVCNELELPRFCLRAKTVICHMRFNNEMRQSGTVNEAYIEQTRNSLLKKLESSLSPIEKALYNNWCKQGKIDI